MDEESGENQESRDNRNADGDTPPPAAPDVLGGGEPLLARVRAESAAPGTQRVRFALGYLFVPGLAPVWGALEDGPAREVQLLIGNTATVPTDEQRVAVENLSAGAGGVPPELDVAASARAERARTVRDTAGALRENLRHVPRTDAHARLLIGLARAVAQNRLRVRIYGDGRLHAKAYLFDRPTAPLALVGSTNLTLPTPAGIATELNVAVRDPAGYAAVSSWFDGLWAASQDFSRDLVAELSRGWPLAG
jgi:phosphatidylserine/phosphatidylglycerophosphate/cardiolipin synthase-like enzyme